MYVKLVIHTRITRRNHNGLSLWRKTDVTDKTFVENSVDSLAIKMAAFR